MKTCGDCPWYGETYHIVCPYQRDEDGFPPTETKECDARRAFRVIRDHCRELQSELARVKAEVRHIIENQLCEPCDARGWLEKIAAPAQEVMEAKP